MRAKLYWFRISHPAQAVQRMLDLKGIEHDFVNVMPGNQKVHLRLAGFRGGTVPALKIDGKRVQGSREIARFLDELQPDPPLFPADADERREADEIERWGDVELQNVPRRIMRWGMVHNVSLRRWLGEVSHIPGAGVAARTTGLVARYYARDVQATEENARRAVASLPELLERVDGMLASGPLSVAQPNAATYQVLCSVRTLEGFEDLAEIVRAHPSAGAARQLFPEAFSETPAPRFVPQAWLPR